MQQCIMLNGKKAKQNTMYMVWSKTQTLSILKIKQKDLRKHTRCSQ